MLARTTSSLALLALSAAAAAQARLADVAPRPHPGGLRISACFADLDGDRVLDVVSGNSSVDRGPLFSVGALYVWYGGASLTGDLAPAAILQAIPPPGGRRGHRAPRRRRDSSPRGAPARPGG